ncbi:hypothetical protein T03_172 [Trichinella britovi]|uniref:Uncharacterized protein n=1 Tax=Trichinella britovi TaxID=45882 RepID=A0A0V1DFC4_TRIBR|nr:hypothetical protein T03_172 [Trichinella britovi]
MPTKQDGLYYTISGSVEKDCTKISVTICKASAFCSIRQQSTFYCAVFDFQEKKIPIFLLLLILHIFQLYLNPGGLNLGICVPSLRSQYKINLE